MKKITYMLFLCILLITKLNLGYAQPIWQNTIGLANDSGSKFDAVKVLVDNTEQIYVLTNYSKILGIPPLEEKIILKKFDENGILLWTYTFDNAGNNNIRGFDMCLDGFNNIYIAGGKIDISPYGVMLLKITAQGAFDWVQFSNSAFNTDWYSEITFRNNLFYVRANAGVAVYDQTGTEQYSIAQYNSAFDVDYNGRIIMAVYASNYNLVRYTNTGNVDLTDSTLTTDKIFCDFNNDIYLASGQNGMTAYQLVKYDANFQYQWSLTGLPITPPFGDFSYGILETGQNEFILYGVNDTIIKFNNQGQILWKKNMGGLDDYIISGKIFGNGFILLTGTLSGFAGNDVNTKIFNTNGIEVWGQLYSGVIAGSEFGVDVDVANNGIYVISQLDDSTNVMKYLNPASGGNVDFSQVCVDSVWIDTSGMVHINVFNGNFVHMNYPIVSIVSPAGDTISTNNINFFAQLGNTYQEYINSITDTTISDFSNYVFVMQNAFNPDTMVQIGFCTTTVRLVTQSDLKISIFPNPCNQYLTFMINNLKAQLNADIEFYSITGQFEKRTKLSTANQTIDISGLSQGLHLVRILNDGVYTHLKIVKE